MEGEIIEYKLTMLSEDVLRIYEIPQGSRKFDSKILVTELFTLNLFVNGIIFFSGVKLNK